ncbi:hypothetical protein AHAS_Ahas15G0116800 [Arachis hypogaea]
MYNEIWKQRRLQSRDVNATIRYLEGLACMDGKIFWRYKVGAGQHQCNLFWSNGHCQEDYSVFDDVLAFNATYCRNKYNLPILVFSGVNHHNQTCVFVFGMHARKGGQSFITDGDPTMRIAIQSVFPDVHHQSCAWHLLRNATSNICDPRFTQLFRYCMLADMEIDEFEVYWESMVNECGVSEVDWVKCESLNAKLGRFVESGYGVLESVTNFQRCVNFLWDNEDKLEFHSWYVHLYVYTIQKYQRHEMTWQVYREPISNSFRCTCMRMESFAIPWVHIVAVCVRLDLRELPKSLVLRRWSKTAKMEPGNENIDNYTSDRSISYRTRLGAFSQLCKQLASVACMSDEDFKVYSKKLLADAVFLEIKYRLRPVNNVLTTVADVRVKDPVRVRTKGTGRCSQPGGSAVKNRRKCSSCGKLEHRRTRYNGGMQATTTNEKPT